MLELRDTSTAPRYGHANRRRRVTEAWLLAKLGNTAVDGLEGDDKPPAATRPTDRRPVMTPSPAATAALRKTLAVLAPPKRPGEPADEPDHDDPLDVDDGLEVDDGLDVDDELADDNA
jgi:hypothetical protein